MSGLSEFGRLWRAASLGDREAAERVVRDYGPHIRRVAARYIREYDVADRVEPDDLFDSVFRVVLTDPSHLDGLDPLQIVDYLHQMVKHKAADAARKKGAEKRYLRQRKVVLGDRRATADPAENPAAAAEWKELLELAYDRLTAEERMICQWRLDGCSWPEIAQRMHCTAVCAQKKYQRAIGRIRSEFPVY